jgi:hypothetical protein
LSAEGRRRADAVSRPRRAAARKRCDDAEEADDAKAEISLVADDKVTV